MNNGYAYPGNELELFSHAVHWKTYFSSLIKPYIGGDVLEAGAGLGKNSMYLMTASVKSWVLLEPDIDNVTQLQQLKSEGNLPLFCTVIHGTTGDIQTNMLFDCILYIDVMEHIENDHEEFRKAAALLRPGGKLIVLSPAHNWLMSPFDKAIGHFRRYNRKSLAAPAKESFTEKKIHYIDSAGLLASISNRFILRQQMPEKKQILFWDRYLVPVSKITDRLFRYKIGKTILGIWEKK